VITYNYEDIDQVVSELQRIGNVILEEARDLKTQVDSAMGDWSGATHDQYVSMSDDLQTDIKANVDWLGEAGAKMKAGAGDMQDQDVSSAKGMRH
jgi:WXG100 family type VII secretion target